MKTMEEALAELKSAETPDAEFTQDAKQWAPQIRESAAVKQIIEEIAEGFRTCCPIHSREDITYACYGMFHMGLMVGVAMEKADLPPMKVVGDA